MTSRGGSRDYESLMEPSRTTLKSSYSTIKAVMLGAIAVVLVTMFIYGLVTTFSVYGAKNVENINGVLPRNGGLGLVAGTGIAVDNVYAQSLVEVRATGVQQVTGVTPGISVTGGADNRVVENTGVVSLTAGAGMTIAGFAGTPTLINAGLLNATAGPGMDLDFSNPQEPVLINLGVRNVTAVAANGLEVDYSAPRTPVLSHALSRQMQLPAASAQGPVVRYQVLPFTTGANTWVRPPYGVVPGEGGQGDSGVLWNVPAVGLYLVSATCYVDINLQAMNNRVGLTLALATNSTSSDPASGYTLPGGILRLDVSRTDVNAFTAPPTTTTAAPSTASPTTKSPTVAPTTAAPTTKSPTAAPTATVAPTESPTEAPTDAPTTLAPTSAPSTGSPTVAPTTVPPMLNNFPISVTATFQACVDCAVRVGADGALYLHLMLDNMGSSPDVLSMTSECVMQVSRIV